MRFHPLMRTAVCQGVAMAAFALFLGLMVAYAPAPGEPMATAAAAPAAAFAAVVRSHAAELPPEAEAKPPDPERAAKPRSPERFRPSSDASDDDPVRPDLPRSTAGRPADAERVVVPPRDLPLSYLMKFRSMEEFHAFLAALPADPDATVMSCIRIEGLPDGVPALQRLLRSYHMAPFLFNPDRFNYIITGEMKILRDEKSVADYVSTVGRYLKEDRPNAACAAIRQEMVNRALAAPEVTAAIGDRSEFGRMKLGLASQDLRRFLRQLETDTARQLTELTGAPVAVADIACIDCRFREVNGVTVLVPWRAQLGRRAEGIALWRDG